MNNENSFSYTYSARENQEVLNIRKKYLPQSESKLEELKRLDHLVQNSGVTESLCAGIGGCLIFGLGSAMVPGIAIGLLGLGMALFTYPIYKRILNSRKKKYASKILDLSKRVLKG